MHHLAIATKNLHRLKEFYDSIPCLQWTRDHWDESGELRSVWYEILPQKIILMLEKKDILQAPHALVFSVQTAGLSTQSLDSKKFLWVAETDFTKYFLDPDGNRLGFSTYPLPWRGNENQNHF
jgi:catechol 2,3-dioxygenase-like lactoylglutathione lyase family enzyme